ncbi:MAG: tetratricopeptide repeat protein [Pirellulales bacterium]
MDHVQRQDEFDRACAELREGEFATALARLDQLVAEDGDNAPYRYVRAHAMLLQGNVDDALREAQRGVKLSPNSAAAQQVLAWCAWQSNNLGLAQAALENLVELHARSPESLADYAEFMACERGPKLGEEAARQALAADNKSATAWAALGISQHRQHRPAEAEASLMRALALDSDNPRAQWAMVRLLQEKGEHSQADALASFLKDSPGGEEFAERIHREAVRRRTVAKLFDRAGVAEAATNRVYRLEQAGWGVGLALFAIILGGAAILYPEIRPLLALAILWSAAYFVRRWIYG